MMRAERRRERSVRQSRASIARRGPAGIVRVTGPTLCALAAATAWADGVMQYGDKNLLNAGTYPTDPTTGATLQGLAPGVVTAGAPAAGHGFPFSPQTGEFPGTDQIYVGSNQTAAHDGYAGYSGRTPGPQRLTLNYGPLVPGGQTVQTLTLGVAFDDFQQPLWGQPYIVRVNGVDVAPLSALVSSLSQTGPLTRFYSIGIDPAILTADHTLVLTIDQGGDGGDGWAVDFLTIGVTTGTACYANCDGSTTPPILNVSDYICFLNRYGAGCP